MATTRHLTGRDEFIDLVLGVPVPLLPTRQVTTARGRDLSWPMPHEVGSRRTSSFPGELTEPP